MKKKAAPNNAYSLWRMNGCQQGFRSAASFGFGGQEGASKPPQAICKPLGVIRPEFGQNNCLIVVIGKNIFPLSGSNLKPYLS